MLSAAEVSFVQQHELCRLATLDATGWPHLVPVCYIYWNHAFYIVTDLGTRKLRNVQRNPRVALLVDRYKPNKGVLVFGEAEVLTRGEEFLKVSELFFKKFSWAKEDPWGEGEAAVIKVKPLRKVSWGLSQ
jgi:nitroimidazol reductase NimA-like FMN-containing flavoprotein (pyridoxamine 5'-phosphate oxidase superfamily)